MTSFLPDTSLSGIDLSCPFCKKGVEKVVLKKSGAKPCVNIVMYFHDDGELHFVVNDTYDREDVVKTLTK